MAVREVTRLQLPRKWPGLAVEEVDLLTSDLLFRLALMAVGFAIPTQHFIQ
jgi:hypothetical protein